MSKRIYEHRHLDSHRPSANPDDPVVQRPPTTRRGRVMPGPNFLGLEGRTAIVQGQVFIVAVILIVQLWLITSALHEYLSGRPDLLTWLAVISAGGFVLALIVTLWPRRLVKVR